MQWDMNQGGYQPIPANDPQEAVEDTDPAIVEPEPNVDDFAPFDSSGKLVHRVVAELRRHQVSWHRQGFSNQIWGGDHEEPEDSTKGRLSVVLVKFGSPVEVVAYNLRQFLVLLDLVFVPFVIAFRPIYPVEVKWQVQATDLSLTFLFLLLAGPMRLQTSFVSPLTRSEVTDQRRICRAVLRSYGFWLDMFSVAAFPLLYAPYFCQDGLVLVGRALQILSTLRLLKCWQLGRSVSRDILLGSEPFVGMFSKVILAIYVIAHIFACLWFWGKMDSAKGFGREWARWSGWPDQGSAQDRAAAGVVFPFGVALDHLWLNYIRALKDGIYMLTTWGGPDALSDTQLLLSCLLGPTSAVLSGIILAQIVEINARFSVLQTQYANRMAMVSAACDGLCLPQELRGRITRYHSYLAFHQVDENSKDMLFGGLSVQLFAEVKLHTLKEVMVATPFFEGLPSRLLSFLIVSFEETTFSPGDFVTRKGEIGDMMHIILRGSVAICIQNMDNIVKMLQQGSCFGEISLVFPFPRTAWVYASSYAMLMALTKDKFDYVLMECPSEKHVIVSRILRSCRPLLADLERIVASGDASKSVLAKQVIAQIKTEFADEPEALATQPKNVLISESLLATGLAGLDNDLDEADEQHEGDGHDGVRSSKRTSMTLGHVAGAGGAPRRMSLSGAGIGGGPLLPGIDHLQHSYPSETPRADDHGGEGVRSSLISIEERLRSIEQLLLSSGLHAAPASGSGGGHQGTPSSSAGGPNAAGGPNVLGPAARSVSGSFQHGGHHRPMPSPSRASFESEASEQRGPGMVRQASTNKLKELSQQSPKRGGWLRSVRL